MCLNENSMATITLREKLERSGHLDSNMTASSILIKKLEVYGYINSRHQSDIFDNFSAFLIINRDAPNEILCSNFLYQKSDNVSIVVPIYKSLRKCEAYTEYHLEDFYVPSLMSNRWYREIMTRSKYASLGRMPAARRDAEALGVLVQENMALFPVEEGRILCLDKDGEVKSVGEELLVICRYLHDGTGRMCYAKYSLDELYIDDENEL